MMKSYSDAVKLINKYLKNENLKKHCYAVETAMSRYAEKFLNEGKIKSEDIETWKIVGLIHDFDYEKFESEHPQKGSKILKEEGWPDEIIRALLSHADYTGVKRESLMEKTLYAVDELTGFIVACALVRPDKLASLEAKSVIKKTKNKAFAAKINRNNIINGAKELGIPLEDHINFVIEAMKKDPRLGL